jgi:hypothetical protein
MVSRSLSSVTACSGPDITQRFGLFAAARSTPRPRRGRSSSSANGTMAMAPRGSCCIRRPRAAISIKASGREKTPATHAATYSPMLCPIIARGCSPQLIHNRANAYSIVNSAGWVSAVCSNRAAASSLSAAAGNRSQRISNPSSDSRWRAH